VQLALDGHALVLDIPHLFSVLPPQPHIVVLKLCHFSAVLPPLLIDLRGHVLDVLFQLQDLILQLTLLPLQLLVVAHRL
jgi:hypothetical protein